MMKLLFARLLPGAAAVGIFTSALSPVQGTLKIFAIAADALSGETQGEEAPPPLDPKVIEELQHPGSTRPAAARRDRPRLQQAQEPRGLRQSARRRAEERGLRVERRRPRPQAHSAEGAAGREEVTQEAAK